jgi:hyperosmotically inducible periplasmic protein
MLSKLWKLILIALLLIVALAQPASVLANTAQGKKRPELTRKQQTGKARDYSHTWLMKEVRHELLTLPYYNVFDWLEADVRTDGTVILKGEVVRPTTRSEAEARVKSIEGISRVVNEVEVLPLSPNDDNLRVALYRAIFNWDSPLFRYATHAVPPIHIIVKNGRATLKGVVANEGDKNLAYTAARGVAGVFEVKNELRVENQVVR